MNKKTTGILIITTLLIGIATAGLTSFLSNVVIGSVEIEGPVFYLEEGDKLLLNELPVSSDNLILIDGNFFESDSLNINSLYDSTFTIKVCVKTDGDGSSKDLSFTILNDDREICQTEVKGTTATQSCSNKEFSCSSEGVIDMSGNKKLILRLNGEFGLNYYIRKDNEDGTKSARIEISAT